MPARHAVFELNQVTLSVFPHQVTLRVFPHQVTLSVFPHQVTLSVFPHQVVASIRANKCRLVMPTAAAASPRRPANANNLG